MTLSKNALSDEELDELLQELGVTPTGTKKPKSSESIETLLLEATHLTGGLPPKLKEKIRYLHLSLIVMASLFFGFVGGRITAPKENVVEELLPILSEIRHTIHTISHPPEEIIEPLSKPDEIESLAPETIV